MHSVKVVVTDSLKDAYGAGDDRELVLGPYNAGVVLEARDDMLMLIDVAFRRVIAVISLDTDSETWTVQRDSKVRPLDRIFVQG